MDIKENIRQRLGSKIIDWQEKNAKRIYFTVKKEEILETAKVLFKELNLRFCIATGIDTPRAFEILYHFSFDKTGQIFSARVFIEDKKNPEINSIASLFPGAEWIEREIWELLGINFIGHPNLKRLLLADEWPQGQYPLRHQQ
jgi:NADH:ubiquinone oxidoreductase subunit C